MATGDHDDQQRQVVEVGDDGHHQAPPSEEYARHVRRRYLEGQMSS